MVRDLGTTRIQQITPQIIPNMSQNAWRVELELLEHRKDPLGHKALVALQARGLNLKKDLRVGRGYLLPSNLKKEQVELICKKLLADPVNEEVRIIAPNEKGTPNTLLVRRMSGVTDPEADSAMRALTLLNIDLGGSHIESYRSYRCIEKVDNNIFLTSGGPELANLTIEEAYLGQDTIQLHSTPSQKKSHRREVATSTLNSKELLSLSKKMSLALTEEEMIAIQEFFLSENREPTDAELETLAQTWSEHCKHKTLTGPVSFNLIDDSEKIIATKQYKNLLKETVFAATQELSPEWCWSVFKDNAGVIAMTEDVGIAVKVETHNHPSALDPYGGAGTGIGGCIRDILGTGLGARPFASTDVFCVGPENLPSEDLPPGTMHPNRVLEGVISGVRDYGNRMGIPTVAGTVIRHPGYTANPLVFAGSIGEIPKKYVEKEALPGDIIVALGGRTGRDGIHGATFSSESLHEESETVNSAAVQIGDPITEKKVLDVLIEARDLDLFHAVTDCGAGGFSSAVGEMGEEIGAEVFLERAPLKYAGLDYWEIWISEAQERMIAAVPPSSIDKLKSICEINDVELTELGNFTDTKRLVLHWHDETVCDMPMDFLHGGVPQPCNNAIATQPPQNTTAWPESGQYQDLLLKILGHPQVASKEHIVRQYDHEVQGGTVLKPYQGTNGHGPGDGTVVMPNLRLKEGVAIGCGISPQMAILDSYAGTANAIDEALRNVVASGGNPKRTAILDNFCWGDCRKPDRLGSLVLAAEACYDAAVSYGTPFISGKDSLNNEYRVGDEEIAIPPTLLCTAVAIVEDCKKTIGTTLCNKGNLIVQIGDSTNDGGGSLISELLNLAPSRVPCPDFDSASKSFSSIYKAIQKGIILACHDIAEGGLAVTLAEMVMGSKGLGAEIDVESCPSSDQANLFAIMFGETPSRFVAEIDSKKMSEFQKIMQNITWSKIGSVTECGHLVIKENNENLICSEQSQLLVANKSVS